MSRILALLLFGCITSAFAKDSVLVVQKIDIHGLKSVRQWVVERELQFAVGDSVSTEELDAAHKRLHNLAVFNDADVSTDSVGTVTIEVSEAWPLLPILSVGFTEGDISDVLEDPSTFWDNVSILLGVRHYNITHNADQLFAFAQLGIANGFYFGYSSRWLSPHLPVAVRSKVQYLTVTDKHASVLDSSRKMRDNGFSLDVMTRQGGHDRLGLGLAYQYIDQESDWPAEGKTYNTVWISPLAGLDYRDLEWWPSRGGYAESRVNFAIGTEKFIRSQYNLRGYIPLRSYFPPTIPHRPPVLAMTISAATSTSNTPSFAHYYFGFEQGFRGYRNVQTESAGFIVADAELRFPITGESTYNVPFIGRWGRRWPIGMAGVLFVQRGELQLDNTRTPLFAYGGGVYLRVPYVQIVELGLAVNRDAEHEFSLKLGVGF